MATQDYKVKAPDGQMITVRGPAGASQSEVIAQAKRLYAQRQQDAQTQDDQVVAHGPDEDVPILDESGNLLNRDYRQPSPEGLGAVRQAASNYLGRGEAALTLATGLTGGAAGMIGGTIGGVARELANGEFGSRDAADRIEQSANEGAQMLTYAPRTEAGVDATQAAGEFLAPLSALGPMVSEGAALAQGARNAATMARASMPARAASPAAAPVAEALAPKPAPIQTVEGVAKSITDTASASKRKQIPTMERLAAEVQPDETILQAAERLGIRDALIPSQYSRSQAYREIEQGLASIPGSQLNVQQKAAAQALAQKADDLIQRYGGDVDKAAVSGEFKSSGLKVIDDLQAQSDALYKKVGEAIPPNSKVTANSTIEMLRQKAEELGGASYLSAVERRALAGASSDPTYARLDLIRRQVGEGLRGRGPFKDAESGSLKRLYGALTEDQQAAADALGAGELFSSAKQLVASRKAIEDDLTAAIGKDLSGAITAKTGNAIKALGSGNYKDFDKLMSLIPKDMQQRVVMTSLNDVFTAGSRAEKQLSAPGFVDWYEGLSRNAGARSRLNKYMPPEAKSTLDDIFKVARGMRNASKERITTGRIQALMENFANEGGMLAKLYGVGKQVAVAEGAGSAVGLPGAGTVGVMARVMSKEKTPITKAADSLLSSQQFRSSLEAYMRSGGSDKVAKAAEKSIARSKPYKQWINSLPPADRAAVNSVGVLQWLGNQVDEEGKNNP